MKRLFIALLCSALFVGLYACMQTEPERGTTTEATVKNTHEINTKEATTELIVETIVTTKASIPTAITIKISENDPFFEIVRTHTKIYNDRLNNNFYAPTPYYTFYDIDDNGTKALFLGIDGGRLGIYFDTIYVIQKEVIVAQEQFKFDFDDYHVKPPSMFMNGTIRSNHDVDSELRFAYYRFEDGEFRLQIRLIDDFGEYYRSHGYHASREPITKEEFERLKQELEGDGQVVELDWKPLAEFGATP